MRARVFAAAITFASFGYLALSLDRVRKFVETGNAPGFFFAIAASGVVIVCAPLIVREVRFGQSMAAMARALEAEDGLPADDLPRTADGRVDRSAADERFEQYKTAVTNDESQWQNWYRLAIGYDDARDRRRAREAMRRAEKLFREG